MIGSKHSWTRATLAAAVALCSGGAAQCQSDARDSTNVPASPQSLLRAPAPTFDPPTVSDEAQSAYIRRSAKTAWAYVQRNYSSSTGLVRALDQWEFITAWDIASALAAYHSAYGLKLITEADYRRRMDKALATLESIPLYEGVALNKTYGARSGKMVDRNQVVSTRGYGWSALDMGRFLMWLKIVAENDPVARPAIERIAQRLNFQRMVKDGYLVGASVEPKYETHHEYQEGRIGYEQYAAQGYAFWNATADSALSFAAVAKPVEVLGVALLGDRRGDDDLTSEPYVLMGLEAGWTSPEWEHQARSILMAQQERFKRTRLVTIVTEDAVPIPPDHFYYYVLHHNGRDFVVRGAGGVVSASYPRWISAKAAFGWHALLPSDYTWKAVQTVRPAGASGRGWSAGVFERSKRPTPSFNLNTAAVLLEAAYYHERKCPLIKASCS